MNTNNGGHGLPLIESSLLHMLLPNYYVRCEDFCGGGDDDGNNDDDDCGRVCDDGGNYEITPSR